MTQARERILASIRDGLVRAVLPDSGDARRPVSAAPARDADVEALAGQFSAALTALSGRVYRATLADVSKVVAQIASECGARTFLSWDDEELGCPGLLDALTSSGLSRVAYEMPGDAGERLEYAERLGAVGLGVTGAHAAIAESGAIVLVSGPGRGRLPSLLPPVHVAVVPERRLTPTFADLVRAEPRLLDAGSNVVLVAGPSRTADIEMTLSHGVHGPKQIHVILTR